MEKMLNNLFLAIEVPIFIVALVAALAIGIGVAFLVFRYVYRKST
jgi:hypothetical protein